MNLLKETKNAIRKYKHRIDEIVFIGSDDGNYSCIWDEFKLLADKEYDDEFGQREVASDLIIIFGNGDVMQRYEFDGSECWIIREAVKISKEPKKIVNLFGCSKLEKIQE